MKPATSSVMLRSPDTSATSTTSVGTAPHTDTADVGLNTVCLNDTATADDLGALDTKTTDSTQGQKPNTTVIDEKVNIYMYAKPWKNI